MAFNHGTGDQGDGPSLPPWLPRRLVTLPEAGELLHVSVRDLRRLIAKGEVKPSRVGEGGPVRLSPEALAALIDKK
ncbi:MAG: helix-turn-helix domain-containing protein [Stellaceae bacterium]